MTDTVETNEDLPAAPARRKKAEAPTAEAKPSKRAAATKRKRRRRDNANDVTGNLKLGVRFKTDPAYEYRWINEGIDGSRLYAKTVEDDWDTLGIEGEVSDSEGEVVRRAVGESTSGPIYAYLCRKPKDLYDEDMARRQKHNDKLMEQVKNDPLGSGEGLKSTDNAYIPDEGISIS